MDICKYEFEILPNTKRTNTNKHLPHQDAGKEQVFVQILLINSFKKQIQKQKTGEKIIRPWIRTSDANFLTIERFSI